MNEASSSIEYLTSPAAASSLAKDPYWPKWDSPWWHVLALKEAGVEPPRAAVKALVGAASGRYLRFFPKSAAELPEGKSMRTDVICFCALGSLLQLGEPIDWADGFLTRYQQPDGGWNCDERSAQSSIVSTVPVLEYLVEKNPRDERLERGMAYLLSTRLHRSRRTGAVLNAEWLYSSLPRFYAYDVWRGLKLVARWAERTGEHPPKDAIAGALAHVSGPCTVKRRDWSGHGVESSFPLADALFAASQEWFTSEGKTLCHLLSTV